MKKTILYTVCLAVLTMTGCDKTVLEFPENGGIDPTLVNVNLTLAIDPKIESYEPSERSKVSEADLHDVRGSLRCFATKSAVTWWSSECSAASRRWTDIIQSVLR